MLEAKKAPIRSGESEHGIEYWFPLEDWTDEKLWKYITDAKIELPTNYGVFDSSMDCLRCTAYLEENQGETGVPEAILSCCGGRSCDASAVHPQLRRRA